MKRGLQSSRTRLAHHSARLVQGVRDKSSWFVHNIVRARPDPRARRTEPHTLRRQARRMVPNGTEQLQVTVVTEEASLENPVEDAPAAGRAACVTPCNKPLRSIRRVKRIGGRAVVALNAVDEEQEADSEDYGCRYPAIVAEDSEPSEYHTAISHFTDLSGLLDNVPTQVVDEGSGAVFTRICVGDDFDHSPSTTGSLPKGRSAPVVPVHSISGAPGSPNLLPAPLLMLTLPTPQITPSPVFMPRSPITLSKYVEATTPTPVRDSFRVFASASSSPSAAPSVPSCDRCCLAQLEDGVICRACEKQWLACKVWYQAHDGGRRRWLTEPYIKPAESTASVRAVMSAAGVSGCSTDPSRPTRGLGLGSSTPWCKELPFKVLATSYDRSSSSRTATARWNSGSFRAWTARLRYSKRVPSPREESAMAAGGKRATLQSLWSESLGVLFSGVRSREEHAAMPSKRATSDGWSETAWAAGAGAGGHRRGLPATMKKGTRHGAAGISRITSKAVF